jgi:hypothetical protein
VCTLRHHRDVVLSLPCPPGDPVSLMVGAVTYTMFPSFAPMSHSTAISKCAAMGSSLVSVHSASILSQFKDAYYWLSQIGGLKRPPWTGARWSRAVNGSLTITWDDGSITSDYLSQPGITLAPFE